MRIHGCVSVLGGLWLATISASALTTPATTTLFVNCEAGPGGDGSYFAPVNTMTAAMNIARGTPGSSSFDILVAAGVCDQETLPIVLDRTVRVRGARTPGVGADGLPNGQQTIDTLVISPTPSSATFFTIAAPNVEISRLSIDGQYIVLGDVSANEPTSPTAITIIGQPGYSLLDLRIDRIAVPMRSDASSGRVVNCYFAGSRGPFFSGGPAAHPASVTVAGNRILYRINGIAMMGVPIGNPSLGTSLLATVVGNDLRTTFTNTGPTTPAALRVSPILDLPSDPPGTVDLTAVGNRISGAAKYGIMIHAGQPTRSAGTIYKGVIDARFTGTVFDPAVVNRALITFTDARGTVQPCALNPNCPPPPHPDYLRNSRYDLIHTGDLNGALIDHPALHPFDHDALGNTLIINHSVIANQTFVVVPALLARPAGLR